MPALSIPRPAAEVCAAAARPAERDRLRSRYRRVRGETLARVRGLTPEDMTVQSMPDASPAKWHLAHTTWFFERFVLREHAPGYAPFDPGFDYLFNSYYDTVGARHPRSARGLVTRPGVASVLAWRAHVDAAMDAAWPEFGHEACSRIAVGIAHEEQHQELILTDVLHLFAQHPSPPAWGNGADRPDAMPGPIARIPFAGERVRIGAGESGFAFDNERPRHAVWLEPYALGHRLVTNGEWESYIADGGYRTPALWLADGWARVQAEGWAAPLHWRGSAGDRHAVTPGGLCAIDPHAPVAHVSYYEADAFARWAGARLPTEAEWEHAAASAPERLAQMTGALWQWTASAYAPYPGFRAEGGALGEYNGKFMVSQLVLRGGSWATPPGHVRPSYRNFFYPWQRWQFAGLRLAWDGS